MWRFIGQWEDLLRYFPDLKQRRLPQRDFTSRYYQLSKIKNLKSLFKKQSNTDQF